ncbi:MAG: HAD family hydrolase [Oscillospiraceae bacterium]|nr:HAD family hydrolase [Oscillospiraceae bacterium]
MIEAVLLDLDGTLLRFNQEVFVRAYFKELKKVFVKLNVDADVAVNAVWAGTKTMALNDGSVLNSERFWHTFSKQMNLYGQQLKTVEDACNSFYQNEFSSLKTILPPDGNDIGQRIVNTLKKRGVITVLATNPLFPECAIATRLSWIGLEVGDFHLVTSYSNCRYCKPNLKYYTEIFKTIAKAPEQCLMAGNNSSEDMCVGVLGTKTFFVAEYPEYQEGKCFPSDHRGTLAELEEFLQSI